jgi:hypothetical protein
MIVNSTRRKPNSNEPSPRPTEKPNHLSKKSNCGMGTFSDEIMSTLLDDNLATANFDGSVVQSQAWRRLGLRPFHQLAHNQRSA